MSAPSTIDQLPEHVQRQILAMSSGKRAPPARPSEMERELKRMEALEPRRASMVRSVTRKPRAPKARVSLEEITLKLTTQMDWMEAKRISRQPALQLAAFATSPWIALTSDRNGQILTWERRDLFDLMRYLQDRTVAGWNVNAFDLPVLALSALYARQTQWREPIPSIDLRELIRRDTRMTFKLEDVARLNLGQGELGDSQSIPALFKTLPASKKWEQLPAYKQIITRCDRDVQLERLLLKQARSEGLRLPAVAPSKRLPNGLPERKWEYPQSPDAR